MKRKIVRQGHSTMTISLPASWIKQFNLKEGDELEIEESGNSINLTTGKDKGEKSIFLDSNKLGFITKNEFNHLYCLGYDEVKVTFKNQESLKEINDILPNCIGFEPIQQSENSITVKSISSSLDSEFDTILRRIFLMLKEMAEAEHDAINKGEFSRLKQIRDMEAWNNKYTNFLKRILAKKGYKQQDRSLPAYDLIQNLERLADEYRYICDNFSDYKKPIDKNIIKLLNDANNLYNTFYEVAYKFNPEKKLTLFTAHKELRKRAYNAIKSGKEPLLSSHISNLIEKIMFCIGSFFCMNAGNN